MFFIFLLFRQSLHSVLLSHNSIHSRKISFLNFFVLETYMSYDRYRNIRLLFFLKQVFFYFMNDKKSAICTKSVKKIYQEVHKFDYIIENSSKNPISNHWKPDWKYLTSGCFISKSEILCMVS